jgi:fructose-bisphosphate aldolase class II
VPVTAFNEIVDPAFEHRYGVAAFNIFNDLTLEAVLAAAVELDSPVIVQTSLATVKSVGAAVLYKMFRAMADDLPVPATLHLDHCPEREWITTCLQTGWNSVLFDGSRLDIEENTRQTAEVVAEARTYGAHVEGEIEVVRGVEDGIGADERDARIHPVEVSARFIAETGVHAFAPAVGTAHGLYEGEPELIPERVTELVALQPVPMVLHGGTGLQPEQFRDLIGRGCAKVNISTAIRIAFMEEAREYLDATPNAHDPVPLLARLRAAVKSEAEHHMRLFGSIGRASPARPAAP